VADVYAGKKTAVLQPEKVGTSVRFFYPPVYRAYTSHHFRLYPLYGSFVILVFLLEIHSAILYFKKTACILITAITLKPGSVLQRESIIEKIVRNIQ